ncbi:MAG: CPBP family intramembrane glutamic endopeptidase [Methylocella sp.]
MGPTNETLDAIGGAWASLLAACVYLGAASTALYGAARTARAGGGVDFSRFQLRYQGLTLALAAIVLGSTWLANPTGWARFASFGRIGAAAGEVRWLAIAPSESWLEVGASLGCIITAATCAFLAIQARQNPFKHPRIKKLLPVAVAAAAANAFVEEVIFRFAPFALFNGRMAPELTIAVSAAIFGLAHVGGTPGGPVGVAMAGALGWILAKSLLETQGMFWPLVIHFAQDAPIMLFLATSATLQRSRRMPVET